MTTRANHNKIEHQFTVRNGVGGTVRVELGSFPSELRACAMKMVKDRAPAIPRWLASLRLQFDDSGDSPFTAWCTCDYEYRMATIGFCAAFFQQSPEERDESIDHEFGHIITAPLEAFASRTKDALIKCLEKGPAYVISQSHTEALESTVEDMVPFVRAVRTKAPNWKRGRSC